MIICVFLMRRNKALGIGLAGVLASGGVMNIGCSNGNWGAAGGLALRGVGFLIERENEKKRESEMEILRRRVVELEKEKIRNGISLGEGFSYQDRVNVSNHYARRIYQEYGFDQLVFAALTYDGTFDGKKLEFHLDGEDFHDERSFEIKKGQEYVVVNYKKSPLKRIRSKWVCDGQTITKIDQELDLWAIFGPNLYRFVIDLTLPSDSGDENERE
jgi:hypothetical protein